MDAGGGGRPGLPHGHGSRQARGERRRLLRRGRPAGPGPSFRRRKAGGTVALVFAGIAVNAAVVVLVLGCFELDVYGESRDNDCDNFDGAGRAAGGLFLGGAGLGALGLALIVNRDPLGDGGRPRLAREHNRRLRHELGLPADAGDNEPAGAPVSFDWAPFVSERGGGINLVARF